MELLPSSALPAALALMARVGGAPRIGAAELAELRAIGPAVVLGEREGDDVVAMVICGRSPVKKDVYAIVWLGVDPVARGVGLGAALLAEAESRARAAGASRVVIGGRPGGYLVPGVDSTSKETIDWLTKRGYATTGVAADMRVELGAIASHVGDGARALVRDGYLVRRAKPGEVRVSAWVGRHVGAGWKHEVEVALARRPVCVHVVEQSARIVGFAAHSARLAGLGTFGPTGVLPRHRGKGIGQTLLARCLADLRRAGHERATIAWVGPREWYARTCGAVVEREYVTMARALDP